MKTDKAALLETALTLFSERGYESVSIYDIGAARGVSGAALYRHFRSKGDLLGQLCEKTLDRLSDCVGPVRDEPGSELHALIAGHVRFVTRNAKLLTVTMSDGRALESPWRDTILRRQRAYMRRWESAVGALYPDKQTVVLTMAIHAAIGVINSAARWSETLRSRSDFEERLVRGTHQVIDTLVAPPTD